MESQVESRDSQTTRKRHKIVARVKERIVMQSKNVLLLFSGATLDSIEGNAVLFQDNEENIPTIVARGAYSRIEINGKQISCFHFHV